MYWALVGIVVALGAGILVVGRIRLRGRRGAHTLLLLAVLVGAFGTLIAYAATEGESSRVTVLSFIGGIHVAVVSAVGLLWLWWSR